MKCDHDLADLFMVKGEAARGANQAATFACDRCKQRFGWVEGMALLVDAVKSNVDASWAALRLRGIEKPISRPPVAGRTTPENCAHYMAWIRPRALGVGQRSAQARLEFSCAGCKGIWQQVDGLELWMSRLREDLDLIRKAAEGSE